MPRIPAVRRRIASLLPVLAWTALPAPAGETLHEVGGSLLVDDQARQDRLVLAVPAFPDAQGLLEGVELRARVSFAGWEGLENLGPMVLENLAYDLRGSLEVHPPGTTASALDAPVAHASLSDLRAFDGEIDFAGSSGCDYEFELTSGVSCELEPGDAWRQLPGGAPASVPIELRLWAEDASWFPELHAAFELAVEVELQVVYRFDPHVEGYGAGKLDSLGTEPRLSAEGTPALEGQFSLELRRAVPDQPAWLMVGTEQAELPFLGGTLLVGGTTGAAYAGRTGVDGSLSIPASAWDVAVENLYYQVFFRDPAHPDGTGAGLSSGLRVRFLQPAL